MEELIIKHKKYLKIPEDLSKIAEFHLGITKLSLHNCSNCQIDLDSANWPELRYLEIIGCKYLSLSAKFLNISKIEQIFISHVEYFDINDFSGKFPSFLRWMFFDSKYIKFKGKFTGDNHLELIQFSNTLRSELFEKDVFLPHLVAIRFLNGCNFFTVKLESLHTDSLLQLWFKDSNYLNIKSLGAIASNLKSFKFENCAFPKLNVDFSQLNQSANSVETPKIEKYVNFLANELPSPFRKVKPKSQKKTKEKDLNILPLDIQLIDETPSLNEAIHSAKDFISHFNQEESLIEKDSSETHSSRDIDSSASKFCPECGVQNSLQAKFCNKCGNPFPF